MSDNEFLVFDTTSPTKVVEEKIQQLDVLVEGNPALSVVQEDFDVNNILESDVQTIIKRMKYTMLKAGALGLAANQVGIKMKMFVIGTTQFQMACFNPVVLESVGPKVPCKEGCVSFPGLFMTVPRYEKIRVQYYNETGQLVDTWIDGVTAQCFQHELDHLYGICYTSYAKPLALKMAKQKQAKLIKKIMRKMK